MSHRSRKCSNLQTSLRESDAARDAVARRLESIGYHCVPVPETPDHKTADLCARHESGDLLIEVKSRTDDEDLHERIEAAPEEVHWDSQSINWNAAIDKDLHIARRQLRDTPNEYQGIWGVWWIPAPHGTVSATKDQVLGTLLGIRQALKQGSAASCYYAGPTAFFKFRQIAFAVVEDVLVVNEFCPEAEAFRSTEFCQLSPRIDLAQFESTPEAPIVRGDHKRTDAAASLAALRRLHPEFTQFFDLGMHRGSMRIRPRDDSASG